MRIARIRPSFFFLAVALVLAPGIALAQTSIALSAYGAFTGTTTGNGTTQSPANQAGGLVEVRHISNPILGFEGTYSFNRADENYSSLIYPPTNSSCVAPCGPFTQNLKVPANAHEVTADWVPSVHIANLRPFAVLGVGLLLNVPSGNQTLTTTNGAGSSTSGPSTGASTSTTPVYVYGAGLDWGLIPHIGLRLQYRGNLYKAPDLSKLYTSTDTFTHTAEPMVGIYVRF
jgi:opacity protein-like surface antigen